MSLGIGILGTGGIASRVARSIDAADGAHVAGFVSRDPARARTAAAEHPPAVAHGSLEGLLADPRVEAVYIATPNGQHAAQTADALAAGKHVLVEKPMALDEHEAEGMARAAEAAGRVLAVGFHLRFHPLHEQLRELVASGALGQPVLVHAVFGSVAGLRRGMWQLDPAVAGHGSLTGLGVHLFDLVPWLLGEPLTDVMALSDGPDDERPVESLTCCAARAGEAMVELTSSRRLPHAANNVVVYGSEGKAEALGTVGVLPAGSLRVTGSAGVHERAPELPDHYRLQLEAFARAAAGGDTGALALAAAGVASVRVTDAVAASARDGRRVATGG